MSKSAWIHIIFDNACSTLGLWLEKIGGSENFLILICYLGPLVHSERNRTDLSAGKRRAEAGLVVRERSLVEAFTAIVTDSCSCTDSNSATRDRSETWALTQYSVF